MTSRLENNPYIMVCVSEKHAHERSIVRSGLRVKLVGDASYFISRGLSFFAPCKTDFEKKGKGKNEEKNNIFLVISCHRNRDRLWPDGPLDSYVDLTCLVAASWWHHGAFAKDRELRRQPRAQGVYHRKWEGKSPG